jgi:hypothetical protein
MHAWPWFSLSLKVLVCCSTHNQDASSANQEIEILIEFLKIGKRDSLFFYLKINLEREKEGKAYGEGGLGRGA